MQQYQKLLLENKAWAKEKVEDDKDFFLRLKDVQNPHFLWIGCSDSRVPANEITNTDPGDIFVHRNIANMVVHTDMNLLSVLQYAVEALKVDHIIVCGHYGCGGVKAAMGNKNLGLINKWLRNIKDVYRNNRTEVDSQSTEEERTNRLVELNVKEQVLNLAKTSIVQNAWRGRQKPYLHGWVYNLKDGLIKDLILMEPNHPIDPLYVYDHE